MRPFTGRVACACFFLFKFWIEIQIFFVYEHMGAIAKQNGKQKLLNESQ